MAFVKILYLIKALHPIKGLTIFDLLLACKFMLCFFFNFNNNKNVGPTKKILHLNNLLI